VSRGVGSNKQLEGGLIVWPSGGGGPPGNISIFYYCILSNYLIYIKILLGCDWLISVQSQTAVQNLQQTDLIGGKNNEI
jgi:hypothetical protein